MTEALQIHHSTSADDLLHHTHTENAQDASHIPPQEDHAHSDEEIDIESSSISVRPESPRPSVNGSISTPPVEIAFSASGGAFVYQMGVAAYIQEHFDLSNCHLSGCSGGSWAAALLASETNVYTAWDEIQQALKRVLPGNASWYSGYGRYAAIVEETIRTLWKDDVDIHERMQQKHLTIAVTRFPSMQPERHTSWVDLDDLLKSILASAMIPFALSGKPCITHRGQWYVDGCLTNFKGINCDQYSTWSDLYYHSAQLACNTVRSTTSAIAERFFPSLTKPVAKLINGLLPNIESPHDAVAPRLTSGAANPQSSSVTDLSDVSHPRILLKPWTWRSHHVSAFHLTVSVEAHQQRFDMGYDDARTHHHELAALLPPKVSLAA